MEPVILKSRHVRQDETTRARRARAGETCAEPEVRTLIDHGVVRAIEIVCACGETTTVQLDSDASAARSQDAGGTA